ncbi:MAG TPA: hypothetical protein VE170_01160 [Candidatus Limnocylindria bacterium]|nr:hypothetical protein [Candidatus Limnocylindria bacterium]
MKAVRLLFSYLLPALIPSWRFFDYIAPSPRIEFAVAAAADDPAMRWREFRPRPVHLPFAAMLRRLLWNPLWNESLFMASCAEKLLDEPSARRETELFTRIVAAIARGETGDQITASTYLRFRIVVLKREGEEISRRVGFVSPAQRVDASGRIGVP